ncbi:MAG: hypothetical protein AAFN13_17020 [Bacteroidota bacterium]
MIGPLTFVVHYATPYSEEAGTIVLRAVAEAVAVNAKLRDAFSLPGWCSPPLDEWKGQLSHPWLPAPFRFPEAPNSPTQHRAFSFPFSPTSDYQATLRLQRNAAGAFLAHLSVPRFVLGETANGRLQVRFDRWRKRFYAAPHSRDYSIDELDYLYVFHTRPFAAIERRTLKPPVAYATL